jgi:DNA mismatch repair protein MutL
MPEALASKIAAGEVVGRPASVVKELMENALDAGAKNIRVVIREAGKTLIQVVDDGSGMSREDAELAFARHATSKIVEYEDLERIMTYGFRGEALASIAAVSRVELRTRLATEDVGTEVRVEGGELRGISEVAGQAGTLISVKNLFYNTPGRRNFMKSDATEFRHMADVVQKNALAHPSLGFRLTSNDEEVFSFQPASQGERISQIFGEKLSATLFAFREESGHLTVSGYLGKPDFARKARMEQYLFLNRRSIVSRSLNHAVMHAYENLLEKGSFPFYILFLDIDPGKVDVNVHPSKLEVKFDDEQFVYRAVAGAVRRALSEHDLVPRTSSRDALDDPSRLRLTFESGGASGDARTSGWQELLRPSGAGASQIDLSPYSFPASVEPSTPGTAKRLPDERAPVRVETERLWQVHNKYIIVPTSDGILLVDQHAAHERVLYERILARMSAREPESQQLLFPVTSEFTASDAALVRELHPLLESMGFNLKLFGSTTVVIDGVPSDVRAGDEGSILQGVLDMFKDDEQRVRLEPRERLAKTFSCKAAVKSGDPLNSQEVRSLLDQLFATEIPYVCPHGRPVIIKLTLEELDRRFGRTS